MSVKMRLTRLGDKKSPFYRIVVIDSRKARDGEYIDLIGTYDPLQNPAAIKIDAEKTRKWLANGVQPSDTVRELLVREGIIASGKKVAVKASAEVVEEAKEVQTEAEVEAEKVEEAKEEA